MGLFKKNEKLSWHEYTKEVFIEYLKCRYPGKNFLPIALYPDVNFIEFRAYPEGGDREKDLIIAYMHKGTGTEGATVKDNYFFEYIRKEYEECIDKVIGQIFEKYKFFCIRTVNSSTYAEKVKTEYTWEYMKQNGIKIDIYIVVFIEDKLNKEEETDKANELEKMLKEEKVWASMTIHFLNEGYLDNINIDNYEEYLLEKIEEHSRLTRNKIYTTIRG